MNVFGLVLNVNTTTFMPLRQHRRDQTPNDNTSMPLRQERTIKNIIKHVHAVTTITNTKNYSTNTFMPLRKHKHD